MTCKPFFIELCLNKSRVRYCAYNPKIDYLVLDTFFSSSILRGLVVLFLFLLLEKAHVFERQRLFLNAAKY
jgi:hypothetical protein